MKYYAVTEDPNELFHYGRLGMKWGQHIFGDKPKSPGYKKALGKLRASTKSAKSAIQKSATQHAINRQKRQQNKYNQAVKKAQRNNALVENLHKLDQVRVNERGLDRDYYGAAKIARIRDKQQRKMDKINNKRAIKQLKAEVKNNRNELKMDKIAEKARQGKLKYGQLSDDQVQRLTNRLAMERNARQLGSAEKTWRQQKKEAFRQGKLQGITRGTAASMEEIARAGTIYGISKFMNRRKLKAAAKQEGKEDRIRNRERNKKTHRDIKKEVKQEAYEARIHDTEFKDIDENRRIQKLQNRLADERDENFEKKYLDEYGFKNEKEAVDAHKYFLETKADVARNKYGKGSSEYKAAKKNLSDFEGMDSKEKRRTMLKTDTAQSKVKTEEKQKNALALFDSFREAKAQNDRINMINNARLNAYEQELKSWANRQPSNRGRKPSPPKLMDLKALPTISAESLSILKEFGLNPYNNGGGGKKNK